MSAKSLPMLLNLFLTLSMQYILGPVTLVIALGAFGLSTGGLTGGVGGGGRSYDMMMTENDPIVAFQTVPLGGGGTIGGGYTLSGEETKRGQRMVCVSSDRLHHIDLRETSYIIGKDKGILTLPALSIFKNNCQACAGVGTIVPRKLCTRHLHPYSLTMGGSWLLIKYYADAMRQQCGNTPMAHILADLRWRGRLHRPCTAGPVGEATK